MIYIGSTKDINDKYDEIWYIAKKLYPVPKTKGVTIKHKPLFAPSTELLNLYLEYKKRGMWNEVTFREEYVPRFLKEKIGIENYIEELWNTDKNILLVCFCDDETLCHRSIVAGILLALGISVKCNMDYMYYYDEYRMQESIKDNTFYLLIAGSREYTDYTEFKLIVDRMLEKKVAEGKRIEIVSGGARGTDKLAERYALEMGYTNKIFLADWQKYGSSAGFKRNEHMHDYLVAPLNRARGCLCFWDGLSKGTEDNFMRAKLQETPLKVYNYKIKKFV